MCLWLGAALGAMQPREKWPQIISHRGACGYVPEHSLHAYKLAMDLGTDYIEPDLCLSKDGVFVVMHDITLDETTDIMDHTEFADRSNEGHFYVADFTVDELKVLRLKQRLSSRTTLYDGLFTIPTFSEVIDLVWSNYNSTGYTIGIYPELKQPSYHNALGFEMSMEEMLVAQLEEGGYEVHGVSNNLTMQVHPVVIQCFEEESLISLSSLTDIPLLQLVGSSVKWTEDTLESIAEYAHGVGPDKSIFTDVPLEDARDMAMLAHELELAIHPYTFRQESSSVASQFNGDAQAEAAYFYCCLGVDATFAEFTDHMRETLDELLMDPTSVCAMASC